jgi:hypothetical protein
MDVVKAHPLNLRVETHALLTRALFDNQNRTRSTCNDSWFVRRAVCWISNLSEYLEYMRAVENTASVVVDRRFAKRRGRKGQCDFGQHDTGIGRRVRTPSRRRRS